MKRPLIGALVALLLNAALGSATALADASTAGCNGFNGRWITTWDGGTAAMRIVGTQGTYDYEGGTLTGQIENDVFAGSYSQTDGSKGTFWFKLRLDGNSFKGYYATADDSERHLYWHGICLGSP